MFKKKPKTITVKETEPVPTLTTAKPPAPKVFPVKTPQQEGKAQIVESSLLENGFVRSVIVSNKSLGFVGEEFPLE